MIPYLAAGLVACTIFIAILGVYMVIGNKLSAKIVGLGLIGIVCDFALMFGVFYLLIDKLHNVLGID